MPELGNSFKPLDMYQISLFPILPSISYKVYFDGKNRGKAKTKKNPFWYKLLYFEE